MVLHCPLLTLKESSRVKSSIAAKLARTLFENPRSHLSVPHLHINTGWRLKSDTRSVEILTPSHPTDRDSSMGVSDGRAGSLIRRTRSTKPRVMHHLEGQALLVQMRACHSRATFVPVVLSPFYWYGRHKE